MGIVDRIILALYTISLGLASIVLVFMAGGWLGPLDYLRTSTQSTLGRLGLGVVGLILLVVSVRLAVVALGLAGGRRSVVHDLPMGRVRVSLDAVEGLVGRVVRTQRGVKDARPSVFNTREGLAVRVLATVGPEVGVEQCAQEIQDAVKSQVKQVVGVSVANVTIDVVRITPEQRRARVD